MPRKMTGKVLEREGQRGRVFALRFTAYGRRQYVTLGTAEDGWTRARAEAELENVKADVRRGRWQPPEREPVVEEPRREPTFHEFASEWMEARRHELSARTVEDYEWALAVHLLPFFARHRLSEVTAEEIDRYRVAKLRQGRLGARGINKTLTRLAQILEVAVEYGHLDRNLARGRGRRCRTKPTRRRFLEAEQVRALLGAAGQHRTLLLTAIWGGGLRVSEVTGMRWQDVDLAAGRLRVVASKTEAGVREVDLSPHLQEELATHKAGSAFSAPTDYVFPTRQGTRRDRNNVRSRVLQPAIRRANAALEEAERTPIPQGATFHSLRHTYASLMAEAGVDPAYTKAQIGHTDARFTMSVYTHVGNRREAANGRLDAIVGPAESARSGTNPAPATPEPFETVEAEASDSAL